MASLLARPLGTHALPSVLARWVGPRPVLVSKRAYPVAEGASYDA